MKVRRITILNRDDRYYYCPYDRGVLYSLTSNRSNRTKYVAKVEWLFKQFGKKEVLNDLFYHNEGEKDISAVEIYFNYFNHMHFYLDIYFKDRVDVFDFNLNDMDFLQSYTEEIRLYKGTDSYDKLLNYMLDLFKAKTTCKSLKDIPGYYDHIMG